MVTKTYEETVTALVDQLYDTTDLEHLKEIIEDGKLGVRQMTNSQLQEVWTLQFSEALKLTDPDENPNETRDHPLPTPAVPTAAVLLRSRSDQYRLREIEERLKGLGFGMEFYTESRAGEGHILKRLSTNEMVSPDEKGLPEAVLALAAEWSRITDREVHEQAVDVRMYIDPALHEFVIRTLFDVHPCLEQVHAAKSPGVDGQLVRAALDQVRNTVDVAEDTFRRISAWLKAGASPKELAAIAWAGGYDAILDNAEAQTRFQDILDHCVQRRLVDVRDAFYDAGWIGTPSPLGFDTSGPVYEELRKQDSGRTLLLTHHVTPNSGAAHKIVAVTFQISDLDNTESERRGAPIVSVRDRFTEPAAEIAREILYRLEEVDFAAALLGKPAPETDVDDTMEHDADGSCLSM